MPILLKRAYEKPCAEDGKRILVERLWPRGLKKENAKVDEWIREVAPSRNLESGTIMTHRNGLNSKNDIGLNWIRTKILF